MACSLPIAANPPFVPLPRRTGLSRTPQLLCPVPLPRPSSLCNPKCRLPTAALKDSSARELDPSETDFSGPRRERGTQEIASISDLSGPVELPPLEVDADVDLLGDASSNPLQTAGSLLLTGALTLLLARTFRRRLAKAKEERLRSNVVDRLSPKQAELDKAKADLAQASSAEPELKSSTPSPISCWGGAVVAAGLSYVAYTFVSGVDETFSRQAVPDNYTVRQITITIRTIVSGLGWLATGVFGANALGLTLYGIQIALGLDDQGTGKKSSKTKAREREDNSE